MGAMAISVLYLNWQRPGVAMNITCKEMKEGVRVDEDHYVVSVQDHKTGSMGPAKLTLDANLLEKLRAYVRHIRPQLCEPGVDIPNLFVYPNS